MFEWIKRFRYTKEQKRKIKYLEELIDSRLKMPLTGFDKTLLVAQYNLAELYAKHDCEKASKLLRNSIHEYYILITQENEKASISQSALVAFDEEQIYKREILLDEINNYEKRLLNIAQKIEKETEDLVRNINHSTNRIKYTNMDFAIKKVLKEKKLYDLDAIVKETKHQGLIKYVDNTDILDKKTLYIYS